MRTFGLTHVPWRLSINLHELAMKVVCKLINGRVSLILNPCSRLGLEFRVSELGLYFQIEKKCFTKI